MVRYFCPNGFVWRWRRIGSRALQCAPAEDVGALEAWRDVIEPAGEAGLQAQIDAARVALDAVWFQEDAAFVARAIREVLDSDKPASEWLARKWQNAAAWAGAQARALMGVA